MKNIIFIVLAIIFATLTSCNNTVKQEKNVPQVSTGIASTGPDAVIYQTKADYNNLVPVILNDEKTKIVSFTLIANKATNEISISMGFLNRISSEPIIEISIS